jgi:hypothetical protein
MDVRRVGVRREAVLEADLGGDRGLAQAGGVFFGALDAQDDAAVGPGDGERGDECQSGVLPRDGELDQLEQGGHAVQRHHVGLDDRTRFGRFRRQFSPEQG